jgi:hypothetical protein
LLKGNSEDECSLISVVRAIDRNALGKERAQAIEITGCGSA